MVDLNPLHLIKKGADAVEHTGADLLHGAEHIGTNLLNEALGAGKTAITTVAAESKSLAGSTVHDTRTLFGSAINAGESLFSGITHLDLGAIEHSIVSVGKTLGTAALFASSPIGALATTIDTKSLISSVASLAGASDADLVKKYGMTKVGDNNYVSKDNMFGLTKVASFSGNKDAADLGNFLTAAHKQFGASEDDRVSRTADHRREAVAGTDNGQANNGQDGSLDLSPDIYASNDQSQADGPAQTHSYNIGDVHAQIAVRQGEFDFKATEHGQVVTQAFQNQEAAGITHHGECAWLNRRLGKLMFTTREIQMIQEHGDGVFHIRNGLTIERKGSEIDVYSRNGNLLQQLDMHGLTIGHRVRMVTADSNNAGTLEQAAQAAQKQNGDREVNIAVAPDRSFVALFKNGSKLEATAQHDAVLKTADGTVYYIPRHGHLQVWVNGQFVSLEEAREKGKVKVDSKGNAIVGDHMSISRNGGINANGVQLTVDSLAGGATVKTDGQTVSTNGQTVNTTTDDGTSFTTNLKTTQVNSGNLSVNLQEARVHHQDGSPDTVISRQNEVLFDGGKGPILHADGSMKLDNQTSIDAHGNVTAGNWRASACTDGYERAAVTHDTCAAQANSTSGAASAQALSVYAKALAGNATMSDISALSGELSTITALINSLAQAGFSDLLPALSNAQSTITETINFALPRLQEPAGRAKAA